jgi:hypothetical protein
MTRRERRIGRLLRWYPRSWRERYGEEFAALLDETIEDGRGGLGMSLDVAREGVVARRDALDRRALMLACWTLCWIPLFPQGIVALILLVERAKPHSWFVALYLPAPLSWLLAAAMTSLGLGLLTAAAHTLRQARADAQHPLNGHVGP